MKKNILFLIIFSLNVLSVFSQDDFPLQTRYPFVNYDSNVLSFPGDTKAFETLFAKFDTLILYGTNQISVLQIGASHTQADIFTAQLRMRLQTMYPGLSAGRGYVFPYNLINTNTPYSYKASHTGTWEVCRNVQNKQCTLGVTGISATTYSEGATITIQLRDNQQVDYDFNYVKILHSTDSASFVVNLVPDSIIISAQTNYEQGYTEFYLKNYVDNITLRVEQSDLTQNYFSLYGIFLEDTYPGIVFHPVGINGASTHSFLKCSLLEKQIEAINPDWVIFALGTNDGYTSNFDSIAFRNNMQTLVKRIKSVKPNIAITIIVPNDDYYKRRYANPNTVIQARMIREVAQQEGCSVWNMYEIMGGYNSSSVWLDYNLMAYDKIHFSNAGYVYLADLFFTAFIDAYGDFMN